MHKQVISFPQVIKFLENMDRKGGFLTPTPRPCVRPWSTSRPLDTFVWMFPYSLFMHISYYTNVRLTVFSTIYTSHARLVKFFNFAGLACEV